MDQDSRALIRELFAASTVEAEAAAEIATNGQDEKRKGTEYRALAEKLRSRAQAVAALCEAIMVLTRR